jgi:hypothetical protein
LRLGRNPCIERTPLERARQSVVGLCPPEGDPAFCLGTGSWRSTCLAAAFTMRWDKPTKHLRRLRKGVSSEMSSWGSSKLNPLLILSALTRVFKTWCAGWACRNSKPMDYDSRQFLGSGGSGNHIRETPCHQENTRSAPDRRPCGTARQEAAFDVPTEHGFSDLWRTPRQLLASR